MNKKNQKNQPKGKPITRETVIIAALVSFILGYAVHGLVISYQNFGNATPQAQSSGQQISQQNFSGSQSQSQTTPQQANDAALLAKVEENPNDLSSWIQLGNLYFDTDNLDKAINAYNKALDIDPANPNVTTDLGIMYRRSGDIAKAIQSFKKAQEIDPSHEMSQFNMGIVFFYDMKNVDGAMDAWKALLRANPNFVMPNGQRLADFLRTID